jgi:cytochrome c oxidase subunit 4
MHAAVHITRTYITVAAALLVLLGITILLYRFTSGRLGLGIALAIAAAKSALVAAWFMHLKGSPGVTKLFAFAGLFWLAVLIGLVSGEALTR